MPTVPEPTKPGPGGEPVIIIDFQGNKPQVEPEMAGYEERGGRWIYLMVLDWWLDSGYIWGMLPHLDGSMVDGSGGELAVIID